MYRELKETLRLINKASYNPRFNSGQRGQLRRAVREIEAIFRSGKPDVRRVRRVVELVATAMLESHDD